MFVAKRFVIGKWIILHSDKPNSRSYTSCHPNAPLWSVTGPFYLLPSTFSENINLLSCVIINLKEDFIKNDEG
jgi:hypothetical protein